MKILEKESNGYTLQIIIDEEKLLSRIDEEIQDYKESQKDYEEDESPHYYGLDKVYGNIEEDYCTFEEVFECLDEFKDKIHELANGADEEIWNMVSLKKNGTFKRNAKPVIKEAINGYYAMESYGWDTLVLRLIPIDDTHAEIILDEITIHY